eukprot:jgi/Mesvir1/28145/Mv04712-RA.2
MASRSSSRSIVLPSTIQPYLQKAAPLILAIGKAVSYAIPVVSACWNAAEKGYTILEPYHPEEFLPMIFGLILIFFGGHFLFTIAAIEAYRISSWSTTKHCFVDLWKSFKVAKEASDKDDKVDANKDGVQDVKVLSAPELVQRKLLVALKAVDPNVVTEASASIYVGLMAAVATLRIEFARTVALGVAIGDVLYRLLYRVLVPALSEIVPREYRKWVVPSLQYACKVGGACACSTRARWVGHVPAVRVQGGWGMCLQYACKVGGACACSTRARWVGHVPAVRVQGGWGMCLQYACKVGGACACSTRARWVVPSLQYACKVGGAQPAVRVQGGWCPACSTRARWVGHVPAVRVQGGWCPACSTRARWVGHVPAVRVQGGWGMCLQYACKVGGACACSTRARWVGHVPAVRVQGGWGMCLQYACKVGGACACSTRARWVVPSLQYACKVGGACACSTRARWVVPSLQYACKVGGAQPAVRVQGGWCPACSTRARWVGHVPAVRVQGGWGMCLQYACKVGGARAVRCSLPPAPSSVVLARPLALSPRGLAHTGCHNRCSYANRCQ